MSLVDDAHSYDHAFIHDDIYGAINFLLPRERRITWWGLLLWMVSNFKSGLDWQNSQILEEKLGRGLGGIDKSSLSGSLKGPTTISPTDDLALGPESCETRNRNLKEASRQKGLEDNHQEVQRKSLSDLIAYGRDLLACRETMNFVFLVHIAYHVALQISKLHHPRGEYNSPLAFANKNSKVDILG
ncbi:hypothetical protein ACFE04_024652 [Oxalis oulophora]